MTPLELLVEEVKSLRKDSIPSHVAIVMDGNRRWAKEAGCPRLKGHQEGAKKLGSICTLARNIGLNYLTVYAFSSENWKRRKEEILELKFLLKRFLIDNIRKIQEENIRVKVIGSYEKFGSEISDLIEKIELDSSMNDSLQLNIALSYGSRSEIVNTIKGLSRDEVINLTEESFSNKLYTEGAQDPDLLIRTGGDMRISNFLLWQIAYSELYFTKTLWPSFSDEEFCKIIIEFATRERRFGL